MARLYVANCTMQKHKVCYRLDFDKQGNFDQEDKFRSFKEESIQPGAQIVLGGDLHPAQITSIIDQLSPFGFCKFDEVSKSKPFTVPYIYREGAEVPPNAIRRQRDINNGVFVKQGTERRQAAAVGVNQAVLDAATLAQPKLTTVEFEQLNQTELGESRIEEGMNIPAAAKGKAGAKAAKK